MARHPVGDRPGGALNVGPAVDPVIDRARAWFREGRAVVFLNELRNLGVAGVPIRTLTPEMVNFLATACRGLHYVAIPRQRLAELGIPRQEHSGSAPGHLHVPVDALGPVTTGISAADRYETAVRLVDPQYGPKDFRQPGHLTPMELHPDGLIGRMGLAEAMQDIAQSVGAAEGVLFCGILDRDGERAGARTLEAFGAEHDLPVVRIADVMRTHRATAGWDRLPAVKLDLPYLAMSSAVRSNSAPSRLGSVEVMVRALCVDGDALSACDCVEDGLAARDWISSTGAARLLVVTWPDRGRATCERALHVEVAERLADLVAADHFGATATLVQPSRL